MGEGLEGGREVRSANLAELLHPWERLDVDLEEMDVLVVRKVELDVAEVVEFIWVTDFLEEVVQAVGLPEALRRLDVHVAVHFTLQLSANTTECEIRLRHHLVRRVVFSRLPLKTIHVYLGAVSPRGSAVSLRHRINVSSDGLLVDTITKLGWQAYEVECLPVLGPPSLLLLDAFVAGADLAFWGIESSKVVLERQPLFSGEAHELVDAGSWAFATDKLQLHMLNLLATN